MNREKKYTQIKRMEEKYHINKDMTTMTGPLSQSDHTINPSNNTTKLPSQGVSTTSKQCNELFTLFKEAEEDTVEKTVVA
jgi:hypothetical protein